jgi:cation transport ATPase
MRCCALAPGDRARQRASVGAAIVRGAGSAGSVPAAVSDFESVTGKGVRGRVAGHDVALGNAAMMAPPASTRRPQRAELLRGEGQTVMFVAVDGRLRRSDRRRRSDQGDDAEAIARCAPRGCGSSC